MSPPDVSTPVVILPAWALDPVSKSFTYPLQSAALGIARSLGRWGVPVYLFGEAVDCPLTRSRYTAGIVPAEAGFDERSLLDRLLDAAPAEGSILVPVDEPGALFVADHHCALRSRYRLPEQPSGLSRRLSDKRQLTAMGASAGLAVPASAEPLDDADVHRFVEAYGLPVVVKAGDPERLRRELGMASVAIADDAEEAVALCRGLADGGAPNALLQEFIPGGPETVWMVDAYLDSSGECTFAGVGRKIRQYPVGTGATSLGIIEDNDAVLDTALQLLRSCGYRGIVDMGLRFDQRDGLYKILDINPRVGATFRLFVGDDGMDVVRAMYLDLTGQAPMPSQAAIGRRWWLETSDAISALTSFRAGELKPLDYLRSLRGLDEATLFARDDLRPFLGAWRLVAEKVRAGMRELSSRPRSVSGRPSSSLGGDAATVSAYFDRRADYWEDVYERPGVEAEVYRERFAQATSMVEKLDLPAGTRVLDLGPGTGRMTAWLIGRGFQADAVDTSPAMLNATRARLEAASLASSCRCLFGDVHALPVHDSSYDLVVALGLLPWVADQQACVAEIRRVVRPGGSVVVSADNRWNIFSLLDWKAARARAASARWVPALALDPAHMAPPAATHDVAQLEKLLVTAGLQPVERSPVGFGPLTFRGRPVFSEAAGMSLNRRLQKAADSGRPILGALSAQHLVLARTS